MKKTYINPSINVVMLNTSCQMLAGSDMSMKGDYNSESITIGSRRRSSSIWDDDDE